MSIADVAGPQDRKSTEYIAVEQITGVATPGGWRLFGITLAITALGILAADRMFPNEVGLVSVFLAVLGVIPLFSLLVEQQKRIRGRDASHGLRADRQLVAGLLAIFVAMFLAFAAAGSLLSVPHLERGFAPQIHRWLGLSQLDYAGLTWIAVVGNNLWVLLASFVLAVLYRAGGGLLILAWNGSVWGLVFAYLARMQTGQQAVWSYVMSLGCVLPHLLLEVLGYVFGVLAGLLVLRAVVRPRATQRAHPKIALELVALTAAGIGAICVAALLEVYLLPPLVRILARV